MPDYSDKIHSEVGSEELSFKLGIGLEKEKVTLDVTTQINVRLVILTLTNIYRIDTLSQ